MTETKWLASTDPAAMLGWLCDPGKPHAHRPSKRKQRLFACACCRRALAAANVTDNRPLRTVAALEREADGEQSSELTRDRMRAAEMTANMFVDRRQGLPAVPVLSRAEQAVWNALDALCILDDDTGTGLPVNVGGFLHAFGRAHANAVGADPNAVAADLLREIVGNPFRPVRLSRRCVTCNGTGRGTWKHVSGSKGMCHTCDGRGWMPVRVTPTVLSLATAAYEHRTPHGHLDPVQLAVLADALEEEGCQEETLLRHLRGQEPCSGCAPFRQSLADLGQWTERARRAGAKAAFTGAVGCELCNNGWTTLRSPHVRGCWAMDLVRGKE